MKPVVVTSSHSTCDEGVHYRSVLNPTSSAHNNDYGKLQSNSETSNWWRTWHQRTTIALGYASFVVVPLVLVIWLPLSAREPQHTDIFQGSSIGGSLTLAQAKAVDFVSSAIVAPLILALFNYIWFTNARVSIVNEQWPQTRGISLYALVEASGTSIGSYNFFKLRTLCCSASSRLVLLAMLALTAALAQSLLSNVVAYEAFMHSVDSHSVQLRLLKGAFVYNVYSTLKEPNGTIINTSARQGRSWKQQTGALSQQLNWQNSTLVLDAGAYVAPNVTKKYLDKLDSSISTLHDVPALRATINCTPHRVQSFHWRQDSIIGRVFLDVSHASNPNKSFPGWDGLIDPGLKFFYEEMVLFAPTWLPFLAAGHDDNSIYVGVVATNYSDPSYWVQDLLKPVTTPFGEIQANVFDLAQLNANGSTFCATTNGCMAGVFGLACTLGQTSGLVDLERPSNGSAWTPQRAIWNPEISLLNISQLPYLSWDQPAFTSSVTCGSDPDLFKHPECGGTEPTTLSPLNAVRPVLGSNPRDYNFQTLAHNVLYYMMELQRIGYEAGVEDSNSTSPNLFVSVASTSKIQRYQMTYIPALLIAGLVSLFLAAAVSVSLMVLSAKSHSFSSRQFRMVDSLRLLVDSVAGLRDEKFHHRSKSWTNEELDSWAKQFMIRYDVSRGSSWDTEPPTVTLSHFTMLPDNDRLGNTSEFTTAF